MDRDEVEVHKLAKKRTRPISSHLDQTNLVNKGFITWLLVKFCLRDTAGSPERARWLHLARLGSQSQRAIWFILPAHGASHIIIAIIEFGFRRIGRILQTKEGVIHRGRRPRWITSSAICRILHILRKPNSIIALLFIQNISPVLTEPRHFVLCFSSHQK